MGKKLRNIFTIVFVALGMFILALSFHSNDAVAATNYTSEQLISNAQIVNQNKDYSYSSSVGVKYEWDTTGTGISLQNGDTLTMALPDQLRSNSKAGVPFNVKDDAGNVIGSAVVNSDNTVTVTFTDVEQYNDVKGSIEIGSGIGVSDSALVGPNDVVFPTQSGGQHSNMNIVPSEKNISKKGTIGTDENGDPIVTWTILANRQPLDLGNLNVYETVTDKNLEYIPGSVIVHEAEWRTQSSYTKGRPLSSNEYALKESSTGFDLHIPGSNNQMYAITMQTKIVPPDKAVDGTTLKNKAEMTWGVPGSNGETPRESASGSVTSEPDNGNSGSGSGDFYGSVELQKLDADSDTTLSGAVYELYQVMAGDDKLVKSNLTTDENGKINVSNLPAGNYYFKEVTPPSGYEPSSNEIPFTISGEKDSPTIQLVTKDEQESNANPEGSIIVQKIDSTTGHKLAGAEYDIIDKDGNVVAHIVADKYGVASYYNLPIGHYILRETKAPDGYVVGKDIEFDITEDNLTPGLITMENEKESVDDPLYSVILQKFDTDELENDIHIGVPGAIYGLYDEDGNIIESKITDENGVITVEGLPSGTYYFQEVEAPSGYEINDEKIYFTIENDNIALGELTTSDPKKNTGGSSGGDTENPDVDNNNNEDDNGLITNPSNPDDNNGNGSSNNTGNNDKPQTYLPQTSSQSGVLTSLIGLLALTSIIYFKRRKI